MQAVSPLLVVLAWAGLVIVQDSPQWLPEVDWPGPLGPFPGERCYYVVLLGLLSDFVYRRHGGRAWFAAVLGLAAAALLTAPLDRAVHQPVVWFLQIGLAAQLWAWAAGARSRALAAIAIIQTAHACVIFPVVQLGYGTVLLPGPVSPIVALGLGGANAAFTIFGAALVFAAINHDLRKLGT
jgi:hypothetical protein